MSKFLINFVKNIKLIIMARKLTKNENYFNEIDTELKAYLLGFFLADGCVIQPATGNKCISMCLQEQDKCVLE